MLRVLVWLCLLYVPCQAQCLDWRAFPTIAGVDGTPEALLVHDDGSGPALYIAGDLRDDRGLPTGARRWNGVQCVDLPGLTTRARCLELYNDGSGVKLYAGTDSGVARWDGTAWTSIATASDGPVRALRRMTTAAGERLYAGGDFTALAGVAASRIAVWDGAAWAALGSGLVTNIGTPPTVTSLLVHDDGSGMALYAGGFFYYAGGTLARGIARWNGSTWSAVSSNTSAPIHAMTVHDDGSGPALYAYGTFTGMGTVLARWNGTTWSAVPSVTPMEMLSSVQDSSGATLYAWSLNTGLYRWRQGNWTAMTDTPMSSACLAYEQNPRAAVALYDAGGGPQLYFGGRFTSTNGVFGSLLSWNGAGWSRVGPARQGLNGPVSKLYSFDDGTGAQLYAGGSFCVGDEQVLHNAGKRTAQGWQGVGSTYAANAFNVFGVHTSGSGPQLYSNYNAYVVRVASAGLTIVGGAVAPSSGPYAMEQYAGELYVGGQWTYFQDGSLGNIPAQNLARFDGVSWRNVGAGVLGAVRALQVYDDGSGPVLFVGGAFASAGGAPASNVARWNGTTWSSAGNGLDGHVYAFAVHDDGQGPKLYAGGNFTQRVAQWTPAGWVGLSTGPNALVKTLASFNDGTGPALYAGGDFTAVGTTAVGYLARWNGSQWSAVGGGLNGPVNTLAVHDDGSGPALWVGGSFRTAAAVESDYLAAWRACTATIAKFCFGDGTVAACPCGNHGLATRGCNNSHNTGGARLNATGGTNPDTLQLYLAGASPNTSALFFQGTSAVASPLRFGDGLLCAGGAQKRLYTTTTQGGAALVPSATQPSISARSAALGDVLLPGSVRVYQAWYRDPNVSYCAAPAGGAFNLSNAVRVVW